MVQKVHAPQHPHAHARTHARTHARARACGGVRQNPWTIGPLNANQVSITLYGNGNGPLMVQWSIPLGPPPHETHEAKRENV